MLAVLRVVCCLRSFERGDSRGLVLDASLRTGRFVLGEGKVM